MAILFDFNGTMFFDEELQQKAWQNFMQQKISRKVRDDEFKQYIHGRNAEFTMHHFLKKNFTRKEVEILEEEKECFYRQLCLKSESFCLAPGLIVFLNDLMEKNINVNIVTASGLTNVEFFFKHLKLDKWFDIDKVVYNDGQYKGKPSPDMYIEAANRLDTPIEECVIFEDSKSGIEAGKRSNAKATVRIISVENNAFEIESDFEIRTFNDIYTNEELKKCIYF